LKKTICAFLTVFTAFFMVVPAYAAVDKSSFKVESAIMPQFKYIWSISAGLGIDSAGKAHYSGSVDAASDSYTAYLTVSLQKQTSSGWSTVKSWSDSGSGQSGLTVEGYYYVGHGTYRVCSTAKIYSDSGDLLETASFFSAERTY